MGVQFEQHEIGHNFEKHDAVSESTEIFQLNLKGRLPGKKNAQMLGHACGIFCVQPKRRFECDVHRNAQNLAWAETVGDFLLHGAHPVGDVSRWKYGEKPERRFGRGILLLAR